MSKLTTTIIIAILAILLNIIYAPIARHISVLGIFRRPLAYTTSAKDKGQVGYIKPIADTVQCEKLLYYRPVNLVFAACEDVAAPRFTWYPPLATFQEPSLRKGSIHVVDPVVCTWKYIHMCV